MDKTTAVLLIERLHVWGVDTIFAGLDTAF